MSMTFRERLLATVRFEPLDRPFRMETIGFWTETLARWHGEGLPAEVNAEINAIIYSGFDLQLPLDLGSHLHPGFYPLFEEEIIEQDEHYTVKRDIAGSIVKVLSDGTSTLPAWLDSPVKDRRSWEEVKVRLDPETPGRHELSELFLRMPGTQDWPVCIYIPGLFGTHRHLLGFTPLMRAYRKQPDLLHDIAQHWVRLWKGIISHLCDIRRPDMVNLWEDMCYKNGPIISPKLFDTFMSPYYKQLLGFLKQDLGIPIIGVDTDGDMHLLIPKFVEAGANLMWPFEVLSGMDVLEVRRQWPREFAIWGGMDKRALVKDHAAISAEVMRVVPPMLSCGGYIPCIDHSVPPDVSFENWNYYLHLVRELGERTPVKGSA